MTENLLTVTEVATALRVAPPTVYALIETGKLPALKLGRVYRVMPSALDALKFRPRERAQSRLREDTSVTGRKGGIATAQPVV